jgi:hypothetical protein
MDCQLSRLMLSFRPADLSADDRTALEAHVASCPACQASATNGFDLSVRKLMSSVTVPSTLAGLLHKKADRHDHARWRRAASITTLAAILAMSIVVGVMAYGYWRKPTLDTEQLAADFDHRRDDADAQLGQWLKENSLPDSLPWMLDPRLTVFRCTGDLQGKAAPTVLLQNGRHLAQLSIVPESQFRLDAGKLQTVTSSWGRVEVLHQNGFVFVIQYTSNDLVPFQKSLAVG